MNDSVKLHTAHPSSLALAARHGSLEENATLSLDALREAHLITYDSHFDEERQTAGSRGGSFRRRDGIETVHKRTEDTQRRQHRGIKSRFQPCKRKQRQCGEDRGIRKKMRWKLGRHRTRAAVNVFPERQQLNQGNLPQTTHKIWKAELHRKQFER